MGMASLVTGLQTWLDIKNEVIEWTDFLHAGADWGKLKVISLISEWVWSKSVWPVCETLESAEWVYELSGFFACYL